MTGGERLLRALLVLAGNTVHPSPDGLERIQARIARRRWWRRAWDLLTVHRHVSKLRPVWLDIEDVRCRICGERPCKNAAPVASGAPPNPTAVKEPKDMTTIIQRRAREVHCGDIIVRNPDTGMPVRWRVTGRKPLGDGVVIVDFTDIADEPKPGIAHFDALTLLAVEPVGGAQ